MCADCIENIEASTMHKPIWTYGIQVWGTASTSNIEIMERFQSKALRLITDAPWYVLNAVIRNDLQIPIIKEEITRLSSKYRAGLNTHPNHLTLESTCLPETKETPAIRSALQIHSTHIDYNHSI
jgi:hypothetical protein